MILALVNLGNRSGFIHGNKKHGDRERSFQGGDGLGKERIQTVLDSQDAGRLGHTQAHTQLFVERPQNKP